jgi:hypothetical protein
VSLCVFFRAPLSSLDWKADSPEADDVGRSSLVVLKTSRFFDAPLSDKEKGEAAAARKLIQELTCGT